MFVRTAVAAHLTRRMGQEESCPTVLRCPTEIYGNLTHGGMVDQRPVEVQEEGRRQ